MRLENKEEKDFVYWLRNVYPFPAAALKLVLLVGNGFPDRTVLSQGKIFFIEFKRRGRTLDPNQILWKNRLERLGFKVYVCYTTESAKSETLKHLETS